MAADAAIAWRRHLHAHPEVGFAEHATAAFVADRLAEAGFAVATGIGGTGVVGTLSRGPSPRAIALRADMDALAIAEAAPDRQWRSRHDGRMHACGHDGHTAALLGAAATVAAAGDFDGTVHVVFQPAEEHGRGMLAMLADGLVERFPFTEAYGLHNLPGLPLGAFATAPGPVMAAEDNFSIVVVGRGGHAARPHMLVDPLLAAAAVVLALQQVVARRVDPAEPAVVSVTEFITDGTRNVIPTTVRLSGDCRSFRPEVSAAIERDLRQVATATAAAYGATATVEYSRPFVPTVNAAGPTAAALAAARAALGPDAILPDCPPIMASEDFAHLLSRVPGNFAFIGNGTASPPLHNPDYDFADAALAPMIAYWCALVRHRLPRHLLPPEETS